MSGVLVLGSGGQLGSELVRLAPCNGSVFAAGRSDADIRDAAAVEALLERVRPEAVVNAAAWTDVDGAEKHSGEAFAVNAEAPGAIARWCRRNGARLVHFGTDYVFDGLKGSPYAEEDAVHPLGVYGESKAAGEEAVLAAGGAVLRVGWLHGSTVRGFVAAAVRALLGGRVFAVTTSQEGTPTEAAFVARMAWLVLERGGPAGLFHLAPSGCCTRLGQALFIRDALLDAGAKVTGRVEYRPEMFSGRGALRPRDCRLDCSRFAAVFGGVSECWQEGLRRTVFACLRQEMQGAARVSTGGA